MKSTGIVRRIDDLGRIVIPREMRKTLGIQPGDPIEFFVRGEQVVLAKYVPLSEVSVTLRQDEIEYLSGLMAYGIADGIGELFRKLETAQARFDS